MSHRYTANSTSSPESSSALDPVDKERDERIHARMAGLDKVNDTELQRLTALLDTAKRQVKFLNHGKI